MVPPPVDPVVGPYLAWGLGEPCPWCGYLAKDLEDQGKHLIEELSKSVGKA